MKLERNRESKVLVAALAAAQMLTAGQALAADKAPETPGSCYGVAGPGEGECSGKDPATGKSWGCAGQNPTADTGWRTMTKSECDAATKHATATAKKFVLGGGHGHEHAEEPVKTKAKAKAKAGKK